MTISHLLEDFGGMAAPKDDSIRFLSEDELEDFRLAAFEQGYSAGWEDSSVAQARDHKRISAEMASRLEDLSFSYHEASAGILASLEPVFTAIVERAVPSAMSEMFGQQIVAQMQALARDAVDVPAVITVPTGSGAAVTALIPRTLSMPVRVVEDPALKDGQADLKIGAEECEIDCTALMDAFREATAAFFHQNNKDVQNG